jgi:L-fuculose-phosphate aldolase
VLKFWSETTKMADEKYLSLKTEMIAKCRLLEGLGYFVGTWGNLCARVPDGFLVTPSRISYALIDPSDFVTVSMEGTVVSGHRLPSSETEIHRAVLNKKGDVGAIIHSHSPYATAVSCLHQSIPVFVEDMAQIIGGEVRCTRYVPAGQHRRIAEEVGNTIGEENAVLLANHGVLCCGRDLEEALVANQILEKAAMMMLVAGGREKVVPIPEEFVRSERHRFQHKYGTADDAP